MDLNLYQDLEVNSDRFRSGDSLCSESKSSSLNSKLEHESAESQSSQSKGSHSPSKSVCSSSSTSSENIPLQELKAKYRESRILHKGDKPPLLQGEKIPSNSREMVPGERIIPLPELKNMLCQQLEYYFSRENLSTDAYLISQMDADNYVPIVTISKFNQIRRLTEDLSLVVEVLRESAAVQVDEAGEKVRPNPWSGVLILREIPESTPLKEIEELFSSENCPKFSRCQFAHNNWYVLFDSDEDTQKAYRYLREEAKTFNGKPVMAQIKAKGITSAPFASYKNGVGNVSEADSYNAQNVNPQQQQQNPLQYTYTNAPNEGYNSQQVCPPFCPPTILQTWAPTTPACVDLGTVLSVNGLSPQAAFRPLTSNSNRNNSSSRERQRGHRKRGKENCTSGIHKALSSLYEDKEHISEAKVNKISEIAIKEIESFKFTVQSVEKFIQTCPSEYKVAGLYVIDSIVRTSKKLLGSAKDVFGPRFVKNITTTFQHLFKCSEKDRAKIIRVLNVWQKKKLFPNDVIETLLDMGHPNTSKEFKEPRHKSSASWKGWPTEESVQEKTYAELVTAEGICLSNNVSNCTNSMSQRSDIRLPLESNVGVRDSRPLSFQSAVLQPHIGASVAGRISPASSFTSTPAAGTSVQHRTSLVGVTSENPHVFHPISTQGVIYTNSPITLYSRIPATSTCSVSPAHPAVLEWAHSIAVSAPLQRLQRPVSSVGAFSQPLYKSEISTKQNGYPCVQSRSLAMAPRTSLCAIDLNSSQSSSQILTDFPARTTSASPTRMLPSNSIGNLNQSSESGAPSQPRYSASQPSTPLMIPHSMPNTNPFVTPDRVICSLPVTSVAACPMSAQATTSQTRVEKATKATIFDAIRQWQPCNPSFVDGTSSSQQSLSAVHVSLNMREEERKNRLKLRQDVEKVSPPPIFGTPVKILEDGLSRRLKNLFGDPSLMDFDKENDKPQQ